MVLRIAAILVYYYFEWLFSDLLEKQASGVLYNFLNRGVDLRIPIRDHLGIIDIFKIHTYIIGRYNPSVRIMDLVS